MFAIGFDLNVARTSMAHPKGVGQAYSDVGAVLNRHGFERIQGSVYVSREGDLVALTRAMNALRALSCFPASVTDIRAFKVEHWSDFTEFMKTS